MAVTDYAPRFRLPDLIERGKDYPISCPVYRSGSLVAPTSGTVTVYDDDENAIVDGASVTVSGSTATYTVAAAATSGKDLGDHWRIEWSLTMPDSHTHVFGNDAQLVRFRFYAPITAQDIYDRIANLDPDQDPIHSRTDGFQTFIDEADVEIQHRLLARGNRPALVMSPTAFRSVYLTLTLALIFENFSTTLNEAYDAKAEMYRRQYEAAWSRLSFRYDADEDGVADKRVRRAGGMSSIWTNGRV